MTIIIQEILEKAGYTVCKKCHGGGELEKHYGNMVTYDMCPKCGGDGIETDKDEI
jgi:DnaJ-class molecular chaperone